MYLLDGLENILKSSNEMGKIIDNDLKVDLEDFKSVNP